MILETIEPFVEVLNLVLAVFAVFVGVWTYRLLGGDLKTGARYLVWAVALFGFHEVVGSLEEFGIFSFDGLYAFTELIFIVMLLVSLYVFKNLFEGFKRKK